VGLVQVEGKDAEEGCVEGGEKAGLFFKPQSIAEGRQLQAGHVDVPGAQTVGDLLRSTEYAEHDGLNGVPGADKLAVSISIEALENDRRYVIFERSHQAIGAGADGMVLESTFSKIVFGTKVCIVLFAGDVADGGGQGGEHLAIRPFELDLDQI